MALSNDKISIKSLYSSLPRGMPISSCVLKQLGVSAAPASEYVKTGWLERLGRGVFMFPNDELQRDACLKFLSEQIPGMHVGGKTALSWRGFGHNLPAREMICLWGGNQVRLPEWFNERFSVRYTSKQIFSKTLKEDYALQSLPETPDGPSVSEPERAVLELLSDAGVNETIIGTQSILENVRSLRESVLTELLQNTARIKVLRLSVLWSEKLNLPWAPIARKAAGNRLGSGTWTAKLKDGSTLNLRM